VPHVLSQCHPQSGVACRNLFCSHLFPSVVTICSKLSFRMAAVVLDAHHASRMAAESCFRVWGAWKICLRRLRSDGEGGRAERPPEGLRSAARRLPLSSQGC
jgi:hypothetical protein